MYTYNWFTLLYTWNQHNIVNQLCAVAVLIHSAESKSLWPHGLQPTRLLCPWGFSRQEYWSRLPCSPPGDLPNPGIEPRSPTLQADSLPSEPPGKPGVRLGETLWIWMEKKWFSKEILWFWWWDNGGVDIGESDCKHPRAMTYPRSSRWPWLSWN